MINAYQPYFIFAGNNIQQYGGYVVKTNTYDCAKRSYTKTTIAGRNGDLLLDNGNFENITISYTVSFADDPTHISLLNTSTMAKNDFASNTGYQKLVDSYDPEYYRLALFTGGTTFEVDNRIMSATFEFDCKPFKYSFLGEEKFTFTESGQSIINTSFIPSNPHIRVYGSGTLAVIIGTKSSFAITNVEDYIDIDSENMLVYKGNVSKMSSFQAKEFPKLYHGENKIVWTENVQKIEIVPRWCKL